MKALLLAAGLGTRLRPITNTIPKCLVPLDEKPLLEYWLENLLEVGVTEFLINTHYLHEEVERFINNSSYKKYVTLIYEKELLNTGGTILHNKKFFDKEEPFFVIHADNLCFCNFKEFIDVHKIQKNPLTMMLFKTATPKSCGIVRLDEQNTVIEFHEKVENPPSNLANAAVYICDYEIINFLEKLDKTEADFSLDVIPSFLGRINTYLNNVYHIDIGTPETYKEAQKYLSNIKKS